MGTITHYLCPSCRKEHHVSGEFYEVGVPYIVCNKCGTRIDMRAARDEWDSMGVDKKIRIGLGVIILDGFLGFIAAAVAIGIFEGGLGIKLTTENVRILGGVVWVGVWVLLVMKKKAEIADSINRTRNRN